MKTYVPSADLVARAAQGQIQAIGRLISRAEAGVAEARPALAEIFSRAGRAHLVGVTGVPGSGKSTLVAKLVTRLRAGGTTVGVIAVDPSSPYSGGAILGDRIRMSELAGDDGIYIRSMATRGAVGGLAKATLEAADILDLAGFDTIIIETVGVGQDEVEIARASHSTIVVSAPGLGDEVQAIKAGMLEIADIHVVSKCDRSDANRTITDLKQIMMLGTSHEAAPAWRVPVVAVSSYADQGFELLEDAIRRHRAQAFDAVEGQKRRGEIAAFRLRKTAEELLLERFAAAAAPFAAGFAERLERREGDPYALASELLATATK